MDKPATILQREFRDKIVNAVNESNLPAFVLVPVLEQALAEVRQIEEQQYKADLAEYEGENKDGEIIEA